MPETEGMSWCRHFDRAIDYRLVKIDRPPCIEERHGCAGCPESTYRGASGAGPLTSSVPCTLSLFRPIVHPGICQVGPAGDRPLYARYVDGHVTDNVPGRVNRRTRVRVWGICTVCKYTWSKHRRTRVRVWVPYPKFPEEPGTHPRFSEGTRRLPGEVLQGSRSGVGLVPVAVNDYSAQKCRCKPGAGLVSAGVPPASVGYGGSL